MNRDMSETIKKRLIGYAAKMNCLNKVVTVKGERVTIPLEGRDLDGVYYKAKSSNAPVSNNYSCRE